MGERTGAWQRDLLSRAELFLPCRAKYALVMLALAATHSHLFHGARGRVLHGTPCDGPVTLEFADGVMAKGRIAAGHLYLSAYRTAAGTRIPAKRWHVIFDGATFRIAARG